jgi:hypothetical protein
MNFSLTTDKIIKIILAIILIPIGVVTKLYSGIGSEFVHNHLGGIIYVIFWILLFSTLFPKYPIYKLVFLVLFITCCLELTQIIQNPFLSRLRENFFFRALFGSSFNMEDFVYYFLGAIVGFIIVYVIKTNRGI